MSTGYDDFFKLFEAEVTRVGLQKEFPAPWMRALEAALPTDGSNLEAPEYAFFVTALQYYTERFGNLGALRDFMDDVASKVRWIKSKPNGSATAQKLSLKVVDGPLSALFEIYTAWKLESETGVVLVQLEPLLASGRKLDAEIAVGGQNILIECFASMGSGSPPASIGFWHASTDPDIPKIRNKILSKADQASAATLPVVMFFAPSAEFLCPPDKIEHGVKAAFADPKSRCISAVAFSGGSQPYFCGSIPANFEHPSATRPMGAAMKALLDSLK